MNFAERLKLLRKELRLTQEEFANRLSIKQNTVANYEIGRREAMGPTVSLICREFDVNEEWLRDGVGEMFKPEPEFFSLDAFAEKHKMTNFEKDMLVGYLKLDESARRMVMDMVAEIAVKYKNKKDENDIEAKVAAYRAELEAEKRVAEKSLASQRTATA